MRTRGWSIGAMASLAAFIALYKLGGGLSGGGGTDTRPMLQRASDSLARGDLDDAAYVALFIQDRFPKTPASAKAAKILEDVGTARSARAAQDEALLADTIANRLPNLTGVEADKQESRWWRGGRSWYTDKSAAKWDSATNLAMSFGIDLRGDRPKVTPLYLTLKWNRKGLRGVESLKISAGGEDFNLKQAKWKFADHGKSLEGDYPLSERYPELMMALIRADKVTVRFNPYVGFSDDPPEDFEVPDSQLAAAKRVYATWKALRDGNVQMSGVRSW